MKKQIAIVTRAIAVVLVVAGYFVVFSAGDCQQPSSSTRACYTPTNAVSSCNSYGWNEEKCNGSSMYSTAVQVPVGTVSSDEGTTSTRQINCIQRFDCTWIVMPPGHLDSCGGEPNWDTIAYDMGEEIIEGTNPCPH